MTKFRTGLVVCGIGHRPSMGKVDWLIKRTVSLVIDGAIADLAAKKKSPNDAAHKKSHHQWLPVAASSSPTHLFPPS